MPPEIFLSRLTRLTAYSAAAAVLLDRTTDRRCSRSTMRFAIGTQNPSKMMAVWKAVSQLFRANPATVPTYSAYKRCFPAAAAAAPVDSLMSSSAPEGQTPDHEIICVNAPSGVNAQPMSAAETIQGATNRARRTAELVPDADFAIGLEGGVEPVGDVWMEGGYIFTLRLKDGKSGLGCSARFPMSKVRVGGRAGDRSMGGRSCYRTESSIPLC